MGQAQRNRQHGVRYQDVELELWELDADEDRSSCTDSRRRNSSGRTGGANRTAGRGASGRAAGRNRTENRHSNRNRSVSRTAVRQSGSQIRRLPERELQIQDIRRYQGVRVENRVGPGNACRGSARPVQSIRRRRAKRRKAYIVRTMAVLLAVSCLVLIYFMTGEIYRFTHDRGHKGVLQIMSEKAVDMGSKVAPPEIIEDLLEVNDFSRPGTELKRVKNVFVHYTANPGTSAAQNRSYFANLPLTKERSASAHLIIGYDGEVIQCIPFDEQAYAVRTRNDDSISIECCYISEDGAFTQETYDTLIHTLAWLIDKYDLSAEDILRHYDCGGKKCPLYYVEHEDAWNRLLEDVAAYKDSGDQTASGR